MEENSSYSSCMLSTIGTHTKATTSRRNSNLCFSLRETLVASSLPLLSTQQTPNISTVSNGKPSEETMHAEREVARTTFSKDAPYLLPVQFLPTSKPTKPGASITRENPTMCIFPFLLDCAVTDNHANLSSQAVSSDEKPLGGPESSTQRPRSHSINAESYYEGERNLKDPSAGEILQLPFIDFFYLGQRLSFQQFITEKKSVPTSISGNSDNVTIAFPTTNSGFLSETCSNIFTDKSYLKNWLPRSNVFLPSDDRFQQPISSSSSNPMSHLEVSLTKKSCERAYIKECLPFLWSIYRSCYLPITLPPHAFPRSMACQFLPGFYPNARFLGASLINSYFHARKEAMHYPANTEHILQPSTPYVHSPLCATDAKHVETVCWMQDLWSFKFVGSKGLVWEELCKKTLLGIDSLGRKLHGFQFYQLGQTWNCQLDFDCEIPLTLNSMTLHPQLKENLEHSLLVASPLDEKQLINMWRNLTSREQSSVDTHSLSPAVTCGELSVLPTKLVQEIAAIVKTYVLQQAGPNPTVEKGGERDDVATFEASGEPPTDNLWSEPVSPLEEEEEEEEDEVQLPSADNMIAIEHVVHQIADAFRDKTFVTALSEALDVCFASERVENEEKETASAGYPSAFCSEGNPSSGSSKRSCSAILPENLTEEDKRFCVKGACDKGGLHSSPSFMSDLSTASSNPKKRPGLFFSSSPDLKEYTEGSKSSTRKRMRSVGVSNEGNYRGWCEQPSPYPRSPNPPSPPQQPPLLDIPFEGNMRYPPYLHLQTASSSSSALPVDGSDKPSPPVTGWRGDSSPTPFFPPMAPNDTCLKMHTPASVEEAERWPERTTGTEPVAASNNWNSVMAFTHHPAAPSLFSARLLKQDAENMFLEGDAPVVATAASLPPFLKSPPSSFVPSEQEFTRSSTSSTTGKEASSVHGSGGVWLEGKKHERLPSSTTSRSGSSSTCFPRSSAVISSQIQESLVHPWIVMQKALAVYPQRPRSPIEATPSSVTSSPPVTAASESSPFSPHVSPLPDALSPFLPSAQSGVAPPPLRVTRGMRTPGPPPSSSDTTTTTDKLLQDSPNKKLSTTHFGLTALRDKVLLYLQQQQISQEALATSVQLQPHLLSLFLDSAWFTRCTSSDLALLYTTFHQFFVKTAKAEQQKYDKEASTNGKTSSVSFGEELAANRPQNVLKRSKLPGCNDWILFEESSDINEAKRRVITDLGYKYLHTGKTTNRYVRNYVCGQHSACSARSRIVFDNVSQKVWIEILGEHSMKPFVSKHVSPSFLPAIPRVSATPRKKCAPPSSPPRRASAGKKEGEHGEARGDARHTYGNASEHAPPAREPEGGAGAPAFTEWTAFPVFLE